MYLRDKLLPRISSAHTNKFVDDAESDKYFDAVKTFYRLESSVVLHPAFAAVSFGDFGVCYFIYLSYQLRTSPSDE